MPDERDDSFSSAALPDFNVFVCVASGMITIE